MIDTNFILDYMKKLLDKQQLTMDKLPLIRIFNYGKGGSYYFPLYDDKDFKIYITREILGDKRIEQWYGDARTYIKYSEKYLTFAENYFKSIEELVSYIKKETILRNPIFKKINITTEVANRELYYHCENDLFPKEGRLLRKYSEQLEYKFTGRKIGYDVREKFRSEGVDYIYKKIFLALWYITYYSEDNKIKNRANILLKKWFESTSEYCLQALYNIIYQINNPNDFDTKKFIKPLSVVIYKEYLKDIIKNPNIDVKKYFEPYDITSRKFLNVFKQNLVEMTNILEENNLDLNYIKDRFKLTQSKFTDLLTYNFNH